MKIAILIEVGASEDMKNYFDIWYAIKEALDAADDWRMSGEPMPGDDGDIKDTNGTVCGKWTVR